MQKEAKKKFKKIVLPIETNELNPFNEIIVLNRRRKINDFIDKFEVKQKLVEKRQTDSGQFEFKAQVN